MIYKKTTPRLAVQYVDADSEEILYEITNRTWMNVGELLSDAQVNRVFGEKEGLEKPKNLMIIVVGEYQKQ